MASKQKQLCCMHPQQRIDSPEPPSRPLASIDGIFAAVALPEDHPHALHFKDKKPELDSSIIRSPGITDKLKLQWRKKSVKNLSQEKAYDDDVKAITSQEVLAQMQAFPLAERCRSNGSGQSARNCMPAFRVEQTRSASENGSKAEIRSSVLDSAEYLRDVIEKPSMIAVSGQSYNIVDVATRVADQRAKEDLLRECERPLPSLPKSMSWPLLLLDDALPTPAVARRTRSDVDLNGGLKVPKRRSMAKSEMDLPCIASRAGDGVDHASRDANLPTLHVQEPTWPSPRAGKSTSDHGPCGAETSKEEPHLHSMDISQQLRSMSQLSDPAEDDISTTSSNPWNFHHRERSGMGFESSGRSRHSRLKSSVGVDGSRVPIACARTRSPTAASSIYSRPTSAGPNAGDTDAKQDDRAPDQIPFDMNALFADWPLRPSDSSDASTARLRSREKPLPPVPGDLHERIPVARPQDRDDTLTWLSPPDASTAPRTSSSSVISGASKRSRFLERFSPPKRTVRKRRSIFKFLRPGSRKQQVRSISTPVLNAKPPAAFDGPSDDPALLTVQYELTEQPQHTMRSASMNQLSPTRQSTSIERLPSFHPLQREPTFADYERKLSVVGDDRRRPTSVNLARLNEIQEEDRRESLGIRRKLSRAKELKDDVSPLMTQALTKHQLEKDAFRSNSKRRATEEARGSAPVFSHSSFSATPSTLLSTPEDEGDSLGPLELGEPATRQDNRTNYLSPLDASGPPRRGSSTTAASANSSRQTSAKGKAAFPPASRSSRIGTSLASWSRYPSHTRFERCGSAGKVDNVLTRDFAFDIDPAGVHASDDSDAGSTRCPRSPAKPSPKQAKRLHKSRSLTFGSIVRYYSNLFHTSGFTGQNRRTSVTLGGRLEHPELELLPPQQVPAERQHGHETLQHWKVIVREDAERVKDFVREEEGKIGEYVRNEESRLESFVREEEDKLEQFVEEEEDELGDFVRKEEGKFRRFVRDEEAKWDRHSSPAPFRHGSIFDSAAAHHAQRRDTMVGPTTNNDAEEEPPQQPQAPEEAAAPNALHLDGAAAASPSKAQLWSDIYQQCIVRPASKEPLRAESMPPPAVKPRIRRFPSVTVIDDQKGHYRSISLISVKTSRS